MEKEIYKLLKEYWGYDSLRESQEDIIASVLADEDVFAMLPTGGGKSLCFQLPALVKKGVTLVVSPLIALMLDQVHTLRDKGVNAFYLNSSISVVEQEDVVQKVHQLETSILYLSPEKLNSEWFQNRLPYLNVSLVAIDEAHCVSQWGYDFRPEYLKIADTLRGIRCTKIALTASATEVVRKDLVEKLELSSPKIFLNGVYRENLKFHVHRADAKEEAFVNCFNENNGPTIVYTNSRKSCNHLAEVLAKLGKEAVIYHAGLSKEVRLIAQDKFLKGEVDIIVATSAFGMGIDKPDIRRVIHYGVPASLEAYYQEVGRAGRDGNLSKVILLHDSEDEKLAYYFLQNKYQPVEVVRNVYDALCNRLRVAYGFLLEGYQKLDIPYLKEKTGLEFVEIHFALKMLDLSRVLDYQQEYFTPSRLQFIVSPETLHDLYEEDSKLETVIKSIIRMIGADIYHEPQKINESGICKMAGVSQQELLDVFEFLGQRRVIRFYKGTDLPVIRFVIPRAKKAPINLKRIAFLKENEEQQLKSMFEFVATDACKQQYISNYFGFEIESCGKCSSCGGVKQTEPINSELFSMLQDLGALSVSEIRSRLSPMLDDEFDELLNVAIQSGKIVRNRVGKFELTQ